MRSRLKLAGFVAIWIMPLNAVAIAHPTLAMCRAFSSSRHSSLLVGTLSSRVVYGAPNYGEDPKTDSRDTIYLIRAKRYSSDLSSRVRRERSVQLIGEKVIGIDKFLNKEVCVSGALSRAETGHHNTKFVFDMTAIVPVARESWLGLFEQTRPGSFRSTCTMRIAPLHPGARHAVAPSSLCIEMCACA